jgi:hypothetical protein
MVQTTEGVKHNPWVSYLRECAKNYRKEQESASKDAPKRRITGKTKPDGTKSKDVQQVKATVSRLGKARAKENDMEVSKAQSPKTRITGKKKDGYTAKDEQKVKTVVAKTGQIKAKEKAKECKCNKK